jgi:hypothetical protein
MRTTYFTHQLTLFMFLAISVVFSHSWVERLYVIDGDHVIEPAGFPRGNGKQVVDERLIVDF